MLLMAKLGPPRFEGFMIDIEVGQVRQIDQPRSSLHGWKFIVKAVIPPPISGAWLVEGILEDGRPIRLEYGLAREATLLL